MEYRTTKVKIRDKTLIARIADNMVKRGRGLSDTPALAENECMLFIFPYMGKHTLWMRGMRFSIDVIWLDEKKQVVDTRANLRPSAFFDFSTHSPRLLAKYVIELPAGFITRNRVNVATKVSFKE